MRKRAITLLAVKILYQSTKRIEFTARGIPADKHLLGVRAQLHRKHGFLVLHVHFDLLCGFGVRDGVAVLDGDFGAIVAACAEQGADYAVLVFGASEGVVEDAEEGLRLNLY